MRTAPRGPVGRSDGDHRTGSELSARDVLDCGTDTVVIATGASWRKDGVSRTNAEPIPGSDGDNVFTPNALFDGKTIEGPVIVFDDDHYYMGGVIAEKLRVDGLEVALVTLLAEVSRWIELTLEQEPITKRLLEQGIEIVSGCNIVNIGGNGVELACMYTDKREMRACASVVMVTSHMPDETLYKKLAADPGALEKAGIAVLKRIGDCVSPGIIRAAVHSGHRFARELDSPEVADVPFRRERIAFECPAP